MARERGEDRESFWGAPPHPHIPALTSDKKQRSRLHHETKESRLRGVIHA